MAKKPKQFEKIPPQDVEAEKALLGSLLIDKEAIVKVADLITEEDFYKETHQLIYRAILEIWDKREPIDILSVSSRLKEKKELKKIGGRAYLAELSNIVPTASHVVSYAEIVQKKAILRRIIQASQKINQLAYQEKEDTSQVLDRAEREIFSISQKYLKRNFVSLKDQLHDAFERIDHLHNGGKKFQGIPTGFADLDNVIAGFHPSDFILLAGRPSIGKSSLALDFARQAAVFHQVPVAVFSLEMSVEQIVDRFICAQANVNLWKMRTGNLPKNDQESFSRLSQALDDLSRAPIFIDDSPLVNVTEIRAKARRLQAEYGIKMLIIDYLQLMEGKTYRDNRVQEVSEISRSLKALARELKIPVIALSQLSRAPEKRTPAIPKLADLRESGCLTRDTLITRTDTGECIPIKTLAQRKKQIPFPIMAVEKNYRLTQHQMIKVFPSGRKEVFELKTRSGRKIKASSNHPFLKLEGWKKLEELKVGDYIALPRNLSVQKFKNPLSEEELILLAHLLGDGCILPKQPFHYTNAYKENIEIVERITEELFNIKSKTVKQKNWYHLYLPSPYRLSRKKHHPITNWFKKLGIGLVRSWKKQIPGAVFQCDNKYIALFLKHLWSTDGNLSWKHMPGRKSQTEIYYSTSSEILAEQVQHLLLRLGIWSSLRVIPSKKYRSMYGVYIEGSTEELKFLSRVGIADRRAKEIPSMINALKEVDPNPNTDIIPKQVWKLIIEPAKEKRGISWRKFCRAINTSYCGSSLFKSGLSRERLMRIYKTLKSPVIHNLAASDIYWDKLVSIKKLGVEEVYDATVEGAHNFVANDIIVHNSLEQDSDLVLFIYRKSMDRGIKKCPEEEKNIAEIHIGKHRHGPAGRVISLYFDQNTASFKNLESKLEDMPDAPF